MGLQFISQRPVMMSSIVFIKIWQTNNKYSLIIQLFKAVAHLPFKLNVKGANMPCSESLHVKNLHYFTTLKAKLDFCFPTNTFVVTNTYKGDIQRILCFNSKLKNCQKPTKKNFQNLDLLPALSYFKAFLLKIQLLFH